MPGIPLSQRMGNIIMSCLKFRDVLTAMYSATVSVFSLESQLLSLGSWVFNRGY